MFALPKVFFRKGGKMNLRWWVTGSAFGISMLGVVLGDIITMGAFPLALLSLD